MSNQNTIAVIDTETNIFDEVMSIGIVIADCRTYTVIDQKYILIDPAYQSPAMYAGALFCRRLTPNHIAGKTDAISIIKKFLGAYNTTSIYAYNGRFDCNHLHELSDYSWYDIMRIAAYRQYNKAIGDRPCCATGRLKTGYGVEEIYSMLSGNYYYRETHNALYDAMDELQIMAMLGLELGEYEAARFR